MRLLHTMKFLIFPSKENPNLQEVEIGKKKIVLVTNFYQHF